MEQTPAALRMQMLQFWSDKWVAIELTVFPEGKLKLKKNKKNIIPRIVQKFELSLAFLNSKHLGEKRGKFQYPAKIVVLRVVLISFPLQLDTLHYLSITLVVPVQYCKHPGHPDISVSPQAYWVTLISQDLVMDVSPAILKFTV